MIMLVLSKVNFFLDLEARGYSPLLNDLCYDLRHLGQRTREKVAQGHKASFCLEDTKCDPGFEQVWNCTDAGEQGISPGCYDIYYYNIDCQWVDVSDITHGAYYLRVHINPGNQVAESDFRNNVATCLVYDYGSYVIARNCRIGKSVFFLRIVELRRLEPVSTLPSDALIRRIGTTTLYHVLALLWYQMKHELLLNKIQSLL